MNRREILEWLSRGIATTIAAVVALPGVRFLSGSAPSVTASASDFRRVKRLVDLPIDRPVMIPIIGRKRDAWVQSEEEIVGRVWLVRRNPASTAETSDEPVVRAFNSVCPHMGCQIQAQASSRGFVCPCHRASFGLDGQKQTDAISLERNHAPRGMDGLECQIVRDAATGDEWVEVKYESFELGSERRVTRRS